MEDKINYIIQILSIITEQAKTIGDLDDYTVGTSDDSTFIGTYVGVDGETKKISVADLIAAIATVSVDAHTHVIGDVSGLAEALAGARFFTDPGSNKWAVVRRSIDFDFSRLLIYDKIQGWENETTKTVWIEGVVLDANIVLPGGVRNTGQFLITNETIKL